MLPNFDYENMKDNPDLRIAVKENDISHSIAMADFPNARLVFIPQLSDPQELLQFIIESKADITFVEPYLANVFMKLKNVKLIQATKLPIRIYENTFIFKKDDKSLRNLFDKEIEHMLKNKKVIALIKKYTNSKDTFK